jgi:GDP/UDP-N,N'-diacetylbacillosamine 2-epimerase (hydrolysing)
MRKKITVVTGSRADYGLLRNLMKLIQDDSSMVLEIIATGSHFSSDHGNTYKEIKFDGFEINYKVEILESFVDEIGTAAAMSKAQIEITKILKASMPQILVVLGDRYEILSAVISALLLKIPVAHIHGGEITLGAFDDLIRHAITKMSQLHFTSTEKSKKRVIQMGESPKKVFNVGGLGVDAIKGLVLTERTELEKLIGFQFGKKNLIVTFHPETNSNLLPENQISELLDALSKRQEINYIFTGVNADPGGNEVAKAIQDFVSSRENAVMVKSLGQKNYISSIYYSDGVIGNSSSGLLEVPSLHKPTINIGLRQSGRECAETVINCICSSDEILKSIDLIYTPVFREKLVKVFNPYQKNNTAKEIHRILKQTRLEDLQFKNFYDLFLLDESQTKND